MLDRLRLTGCLMCMVFALSLNGCLGGDEEEAAELNEPKPAQEKPAEVESDSEEEQKTEGEDTEEPDRQQELYIHVCGQVQNPGVFRLPAGSRVFEAVESAGGMTGDADSSFLNQAETLQDGQKLYVPAVGEEVPPADQGREGQEPKEEGKVDINTAAKEQLMTLNGIGEARADSIIKYREEHGSFQSIEQLKEVEGIKDGIFNKIKDQIKV